MKIFFSSDHHFSHTRVVRFCGRPFPDVGAMNLEMIRLWNETVGPDDYIHYLGDFSWGSTSVIGATRRVLNGTIGLVRGNHDRGPKAMASAGFVNICWSTCIETEKGRILLTHRPPEPLEEFRGCDAAFCGHVHEL